MPEPIRKLPQAASPVVPLPGSPMGRNGTRDGGAGWRGAPPLPPALASGPDFGGLMRALRRRWMLAVSLGTVVAAAVAAVAWLLLPPKYTVSAQLHVASTPYYFLYRDPDATGREFTTYLKTQLGRIKNRFVLNAALKKDTVQGLELVRSQAEPLMWLENELQTETQENSEFAWVSMVGTDAAAQTAIINAVVQSYIDEVITAELKRKSQRVAELEKYFTQINEKVRLKKETVRKMAEDLGTSEREALTQQQVNLRAYAGELSRQHAALKFQVLGAESRLKAHKVRQPDLQKLPIPEKAINDAMSADSTVKQMILKLNALETVVSEYKYSTDPTWPTRVKAERQRDEVKKELDAAMAKLRGEAVKQLQEKAQDDYGMALAQLGKDLEVLVSQRDTLAAEMEQLKVMDQKLGTSTTELEMLKDDIKQEAKAQDKINDELHVLRIELNAPPRVSIAQEAGIQKKDMKRLLAALVLGPIGASLGVCLIVAWWEFRARRIQTADEVALGLGMRVVGSLPVLAAPAQRRLLSANGEAPYGFSENCLLESIDSIRTMLLRDASVEATRVVMVTSALTGEGKTTLASQLAGSLARAGRKTLLIDCDLRSPTAHQLFEQPLQPGFSEVLLGEIHLAEATRSTPVDGLFMIPAGQWDREVMHALARDGLDEIFDKLKADYDFIIVDSHPVLAATDSLLVGQYTDAVLFSLLRDVSQAPRVYTACQRLSSLSIRVLGAVVHGMQQDEYAGNGHAKMAAAA
jgi:capsular exopolysaccharide synthesis family protein